MCPLLSWGVCEKLTLHPHLLLWGKGEEGIIIFDVLKILIADFFKDITMQLHSGAKLFGNVIVLCIESTSKYHIGA